MLTPEIFAKSPGKMIRTLRDMSAMTRAELLDLITEFIEYEESGLKKFENGLYGLPHPTRWKVMIDVFQTRLNFSDDEKDYLYSIHPKVREELFNRAASPFTGLDKEIEAVSDDAKSITVDALIASLQNAALDDFRFAIPVRVSGILYPMSLLSSGFWNSGKPGRKIKNGDDPLSFIRAFLQNGFDLWAPSWDFSFGATNATSTCQFAQLGTLDEANSLPIIIDADLARELDLYAKFQQAGADLGLPVAGLQVVMKADLCHRKQFSDAVQDVFGTNLDYFLVLRRTKKSEVVFSNVGRDEIYSAYVWKCVAPAKVVASTKDIEMNDVVFLWEHTNLQHKSTVDWAIHALHAKQVYLENISGENFVTLQKSTELVADAIAPGWEKERFLELFFSELD